MWQGGWYRLAGLALGLNIAASFANVAPTNLPQTPPFAPYLEVQQQQCGVVQATEILLPQGYHTEPLAMLNAWHEHALAPFLNCFTIDTYALSQLTCQPRGARGRAHCKLTNWPEHSPVGSPRLRQIIFVPNEQGIAFNDSERIVLPVSATLGLFAHEVAHWLGFADEYPMTAELANEFCAGRYNHASLNVVVTAKTILTETEMHALWQRLPWRYAVRDWRNIATQQRDGTWKLGTAAGTSKGGQVGMYPAQTCAATDYYAWRPVNELTPMQYFDVVVWPAVYLELLQRRF